MPLATRHLVRPLLALATACSVCVLPGCGGGSGSGVDDATVASTAASNTTPAAAATAPGASVATTIGATVGAGPGAAVAGTNLLPTNDGQTRYPIVLVHGLFGFDNIARYDYFLGVADALRADGATVFVSQVSATNSNEVRGEQLLAEVRAYLAATGAAKVNLIGHSQGGPTARYVAGVAPDLVASVTSVAGVNKGSRVADILHGDIPQSVITAATYQAVGAAYGTLVALGSGGGYLPQDFNAALASLSTAGSMACNQRFPQGVPADCGDGDHVVNGIRYYSWTGIQPATNAADPSDAPLLVLSTVFGEPNDGLVSACSSRLGEHLGDYRMNHLDEINQVAGLRDFTEVDPVLLYRQHANRLKLQGL